MGGGTDYLRDPLQMGLTIVGVTAALGGAGWWLDSLLGTFPILMVIGVIVSLVAALPALLLARGGKHADLNTRLKLWALGVAIRFGILGAALYYLFTRTNVNRIPAVIGVVITYFLIFIIEARTTLRS